MLQLHARWIYFCIACVSLCTGYLVYFVGRSGSAIYAIPSAIEHWITDLPVVALISGPLPSFFHTYAFILLTFIALGKLSRSSLYLSISIWVILETLFEVGQHAILKNSIVNILAGWIEQVPVLDISANYILGGTFDPLDLLAITIASVFALLTVHLVQEKGRHHGRK